MHHYRMAGLRLSSTLPLPELVPDSPDPGPADVEVRLAAVPVGLPDPGHKVAEAELSPDDVLIAIPGVARYRIRSGNLIEIEPDSAAEDKDVRLFLLGSAFGAIFFQRGLFPLHASVVVVKGTAVALAGDSGAGKSTLAAWLHMHGHPLLSDDVCVIAMDERRGPLAYPSYPRLKLWDDALGAFEIPTEGLQRDHFRADKYHLSLADTFEVEPVPLRHIDVLCFDDAQPPHLEPIPPAQAVAVLRDNTYRFQYISGLGLTERHFQQCVQLARAVPLRWLRRPRDHRALAACQRLIEEESE